MFVSYNPARFALHFHSLSKQTSEKGCLSRATNGSRGISPQRIPRDNLFICHTSEKSSSLSPLDSALTNSTLSCPNSASPSPLESALTHTPSRKPFRFRSYKNIGGGRGAAYSLSSQAKSRGTHKPSRNSYRINTCKSVSKQMTLTPFRMNTYEKHGGRGVLL